MKGRSLSPELTLPVTVCASHNGIVIHWRGVASYHITSDYGISITPELNPGPLADLEIQPLYGVAMAALFILRKHLVLHGSSLAINGQGITIIGRKGFGKSSLTAALVNNGHAFVSDDVTVLSIKKNNPPLLLPGISRLKLWPDAVLSIGLKPNELPILSPNIPKHIWHLAERQCTDIAPPLQTIIMLDYAEAIALHEMEVPEKMIWLSGGQYLAKHHQALPTSAHKRLFQYCAQLAAETRIIRLTMVRDTTVIPDIARLLEDHIG
jgi:hypothetical protein